VRCGVFWRSLSKRSFASFCAAGSCLIHTKDNVCVSYIPSSSEEGFLPVWSKGPVLITKSVFRVSVVTQCACWLRVNSCLPCSASQTFTVRSLLAVYRTPFGPPLPPHRTTLTLAEWLPSINNALREAVDQTRTASFEEEARRGSVGFLEYRL